MDALKKAVAAKPKADGEAESPSSPIKLDTGMTGASPSPDVGAPRPRLGESGGLALSPLGMAPDAETLRPAF